MQPPAPERSPGIVRVLGELGGELRAQLPPPAGRSPAERALPPGELGFSLARTHRFQRDTLGMLLEYYERYGPVFSFRTLHRPIVAMLGPEANHFVTVSGADQFSWRKGMFGEQLIPLIGDGLITTDDAYHDRARRIMMPAFHRRRMDAAVAVMTGEASRAVSGWRPGRRLDVYEHVRELAMAIAMRALLGLDPGAGGIGHDAAMHFERALAFYDTESWMMLLRGPLTPWARLQSERRALDRIIVTEIERRRAAAPEERDDVLSMLIDAREEPDEPAAAGSGEARSGTGGAAGGDGFTSAELRDQVMHLLFGGHDTTSSTLSFLFYELARHPVVRARVTEELDSVLGGRAPTAAELLDGLPYLSMVLEETLRLYPPVWFGPRMTVRPVAFAGHRIPAGVHVIHSAWVSHRLPEVFADPDAFIPERFLPERRRELPPGAYIPFGGGRRICIGKRFGQLVVKAVAATVLSRVELELPPRFELRLAKVPTLSPEGGLPMRIVVRRRAAARDTV